MVLLALVYNGSSCPVEIIYMMLMAFSLVLSLYHTSFPASVFFYHFPDIIIRLAIFMI